MIRYGLFPGQSSSPATTGFPGAVSLTDYGGVGDGVQAIFNITNITREANPTVTTSTPHGATTGDKVIIDNVFGMTQINPVLDSHTENPAKTVTVTGATTFKLQGTNSTSYSPYTSGGTANFGYRGTDNSVPMLNWLTAALALKLAAYVPPGTYIVKQTNLVHLLQGTNLEIFGHRGISRIVDAHSLKGVKQMWWFGDDAGSNVTYPADTGLETTTDITGGETQTVFVNDTSTLFQGEYLALMDPSQSIIYRAGFAINITNISKSDPTTTPPTPTIVTVDGVNQDFTPSPGDPIFISGVVGMTEINGDSYPFIEFITDVSFSIDVDSSGFSDYVSGGSVGTNGLAGFVSHPARIQEIVSPTEITLTGPPLFNLMAGTQIGTWNSPWQTIQVHDLTFITDIVHHVWSGVSATLRFDGVINLSVYNCDFEQGTSRQITVENCIYHRSFNNKFVFIPQIGANAFGIQSMTCYSEVYGNQMEGGLHLTQSGGKTERMGTFYQKAYDNQISTNNSSGFDTHWNAFAIEFRDNSITNLNSAYVNITQNDLGSGITVRGWGGAVLSDNYVCGRPVGIRMHAGGSFSGAYLTGNVTERCQYSVYANQFNKLKIDGHRSLDAYQTDFFLLYNSGPGQGWPEFSGMVFKNIICRGNSAVPALTWQLSQQSLPLTPDRWLFENWKIDDKALTGFGDAADIIQQYIGSQSSESGRLSAGPPVSLLVTTGALSATVDASGVTQPYQLNDTFTTAGGTVGTLKTITGITQAVQAVVTVNSSSGITEGNTVFITGVVGMVEINNGDYGVVDVPDSTHVTLALNTTGFTAYSNSGTLGLSATHPTWRVATAGMFDITTGTHPGSGFKVNDRMRLSGGTHQTDPAAKTITGISQAASAVVTVADTSNIFADMSVWIDGVVGMTQINNNNYLILNILSPTTFSIDVDSTGFTAWSSGGLAHCSYAAVVEVATLDASNGIASLTMYAAGVYTAIEQDYEQNLTFTTQHDLGSIAASGNSYTSSTGTIVITMSSPPSYTPGRVVLSGLTGTGTNLSDLNDDWVVTSLVGAVFTLRGPRSKGTITINGGNGAGMGTGANFTLATYLPASVVCLHCGAFDATPANPVAQDSTEGTGLGVKLNVTYGVTLDLESIPRRVAQLDSGGTAGPIVSLGMGKTLDHLVYAKTTYTFTHNTSRIVCPYGTDLTVASGSFFSVVADASDPPVHYIYSSQSAQAFNTLTLLSAFPTPPAAGLVQEWADIGGRQWRQDSTGRNRGFMSETSRLIMVTAQNNSTTFATYGGSMSATVGTATAIAAASTNAYTRQFRQYNLSAAAIHSSANYESGDSFFMDDSNRITIRWGWEVSQAGSSMFVGIKPAGDPGTSAPTGLNNTIGVGINTGQTTLRIIHADGSGNRTNTDLGAGFPALTTATDYYEFDVWWGTGATLIFWQLVRVQSDNTTTATTGTFTTNIPALGTALVKGIWSNTQGSGSANQFAIMSAISEPR